MSKLNLNHKGDETADIIDGKVCHAVQVRLKRAHEWFSIVKNFTLKIFSREPRKCSRGANVGQCEMSARNDKRNLLDLMAEAKSCVTEHCFRSGFSPDRQIPRKAVVKDSRSEAFKPSFRVIYDLLTVLSEWHPLQTIDA